MRSTSLRDLGATIERSRGFCARANSKSTTPLVYFARHFALLNTLPPFDVLIIGSGLAGQSLALQIADQRTVALVTKRGLEDSASSRAQGGIAAALDDRDSIRAHVKDTLIAGAGLCSARATRFVVERGRSAPGLADSARAYPYVSRRGRARRFRHRLSHLPEAATVPSRHSRRGPRRFAVQDALSRNCAPSESFRYSRSHCSLISGAGWFLDSGCLVA